MNFYTERHNFAYLRCSSARRCDVCLKYASLLAFVAPWSALF